MGDEMARPTKVQAAVFSISLTIGLMVVLAVVLVGRSVQAGSKLPGDGHFEAGLVWGSMGAMRATADSQQFMRCEIFGADNGSTAGAIWVRCTWRQPPPTPGGTAPPEEWCVSGNPAIVAAVQAIGDSMVTIWYSGTVCTTISVDNTSEYAPKVP
jgi:hypothetical protein